MKKLFALVLMGLTVFCSCKINREWVFTGYEVVCLEDTLITPSLHYHDTLINGEVKCIWVPKYEWPITQEVETPIFKRKFVRK
jgi:hypothetical protein